MLRFKKIEKRTLFAERAIRAYGATVAVVLNVVRPGKALAAPSPVSSAEPLSALGRGYYRAAETAHTLNPLHTNPGFICDVFQFKVDCKFGRFSTGKIVCLKSECTASRKSIGCTIYINPYVFST